MVNICNVGIISSGEFLPAWQVSVYEELLLRNPKITVHNIRLPVILHKKTFLSKMNGSLCKIALRIENFFAEYEPNAFRKVELQHVFPDIQISDNNDISDVSISGKLDVIIAFSDFDGLSEIAKKTKYGVWMLRFSDSPDRVELPSGYSDVLQKKGFIRSSLVIIPGSLNPQKCVRETWSMLDHSLTESLNNHYWKSIKLISRYLDQIENERPDDQYLNANAGPANPFGITLHFALLGRYFYIRFKYKAKKMFFYRKWFIRIAENKTGDAFSLNQRFKPVRSPGNKFWADPFVIKENGANYLFIEEFDYRANRAHISYLTLNKNGSTSKAIPLIKTSYHLSYPFIIKSKGSFFMIPESSSNHTIDLYKCIGFPGKWEHVRTLMSDLHAVDTTLFYQNGLFWMFTCIREKNVKWNYDELYLFYSDSLDSDQWIPHPMNPVVSDTRSARCAGRIFEYEGNLFRPAQYCGFKYGNGLVINKITTLSTDKYSEEVTDLFTPANKVLYDAHTLAWNEDFVILDSLKKVWKPLTYNTSFL
jgi:hypothetical protein